MMRFCLQAMVEHQSGIVVEGDIYTPNPLSQDFSVDNLIKKFEGRERNSLCWAFKNLFEESLHT